ncbi:MAG: Male sterility protein [Myxococcaceae bacterium]|nr:Male sterility protein [Myxococcaceae bacterium]
MTEPLSIQKTLAGRHILFTGASGFLGKVWLTMMLDKVPEVGRIYVLLRGKKNQNARARFEQMLNDSFAFSTLHEKHGEEFSRFISERVEVVPGDVSQPGLGVEPKLAERIQRNLDLVVHCAGQVDFNPELSEGVETNLEGTIHAAEFAALAADAGFVQVSTCFVAGNREGLITEEARPNYAPSGAAFDVEAEYLHLKQLVAQVHEECSSERAIAELRAEVAESIAKKGHDPENHALIERILKREAKARLADRLVQVGKDRAAEWGWPNVYTFTKSMGESMLLTRFPKLRKTFFRPAIIESALSFPIPGWNEGLNTSGPLVYFTGTWFRHLPARKDKPLDVVPVDYCCAALIAAGAALIDGRAKPVYQCCTSDRHPLTVGRGLELTALAHRKHYRNHGEDAIERIIMSRWDSRVVGDDHFMNVDNMRKIAQWIAEMAKDVPQGLPKKWRAEIKKLGSRSNLVDKKLGLVDKVIDTYKPFVSDNRQTFACDELVGLQTVEEFFHYEPRKIDWRRYWMDQHVPGLRRWSFPLIEGTRIEVYKPKYAVHLVDPAVAPGKARTVENDKRRTRTAQASGAAE